jgi:hypothetical protein
MRNTLQQATRAQRANVVDLFEEQAPMHGAQLRAREQQERLAKLAQKLTEMLDTLDIALKVDRERAVSLLAEYSGLLEVAVEEIGCIREIDEQFGGRGRRLLRVAGLAEKLEKGLAYLLGMFSVVSSGENLSPFNWKLVERDVQMVLGISQAIGDEISRPKLRDAA